MTTPSYLSKLDAVYRTYLLSQYFVKGWGDPANIKRICDFRKIIGDRTKCSKLVEPNYPVVIDKIHTGSSYKLLEGHFISPLVHYLPDVVPKESHKAYFQILLPTTWRHPRLKPMCLHLAGTGDHKFWRRRTLVAKPLLKESCVGSIILENPYYGCRKPKEQVRSVLQNVSDLFVMGGCLVLESIALLQWCEQEGYGPLAITGISMGGHMASLAGGSWHKPIGIIPCLSWTTASICFTQGVMSGAIPWELLQNQYYKEPLLRDEVTKLIQTPDVSDEEVFKAGREFARHVSSTMSHYQDDSDKTQDSQGTTTSALKTRQEASLKQTLAHLIESLPLEFLASGSQPSRDKALDALNFMRGIMDECTSLTNFSRPCDPSLAICVTATRDAYIPREGSIDLQRIWPGCEVRYIDCGHITAFLFNQSVFRKAIVDSLNQTASKYYGEPLLQAKGAK